MASRSAAQARRSYLTQRLVSQQITMEEATELFSLMTQEMERLRQQVMAASRGPVPPTPGAPPPPPPPGWKGGMGSRDNFEELLLFGGPLLGILAAMLKKSGLDGLSAGLSTAPTPTPSRSPSSAAARTPAGARKDRDG